MSGLTGAAFEALKVNLSGRQLIEASAGTGKTWNICALYIRLLRERSLSVRQLLVLTFTNAAAAELRERIRTRLREALQTETDPAAAQRLQLGLHEFDQAAIHTIHGFCQRALAEAPFLSGCALDNEQLQDDVELRRAVAQDFWRRHVQPLEPDPGLSAALLAAGDDPSSYAEALRLHQAKPLAICQWPPLPGPAQHAPALASGILESWQALADLWPAERTLILEQLEQARPGLNQTSYKQAALTQAVADWDTLLAIGDPWADRRTVPKHHLLRRSRLRPTKAATARGLVAPPHRCFDLIEDWCAARDEEAAVLRLRRFGLRRQLVDEGLGDLRARKRRMRVQTFDDLLSGLHAALARPGGEALADELRERFPAALVDEFQDTDPLQLDILLRLYPRPEDALFLVGDPKQAIYSFRNADLESYLRARASAVAVWTLGANQRSSAALIAALNALFSRSPRPFWLPGLDYRAVSVGARPRLDLAGDPVSRAALNVWLLPRGADGLPLRQGAARQWAAESCAAEIVRLLAPGPAEGLRLGPRRLDAGDIAVLVRSHADGILMRGVLEARGVACVELSQASIFASVDASELLAVLSALGEPDAVGRVLAALATLVLGCDAAEIEAIGHDERALARVLRSFAEARELWQLRGFGVMIRQFLERHGAWPRLLARSDGPRRATNLRQLLELLQRAEGRHPGPEALLRWLRQQMAAPAADEEGQLRLDSDAHLVQIVTVHKAKGLEYPVVFCPLLWTPPRPPERLGGARVYHASDGRVCIDYRAPEDYVQPGESTAIDDAIADEAHAEQMRLIYVALTRAAARCYLFAGAFDAGRRSGTANCDQAGRAPLNTLVDPRDQAGRSQRDRKRDRHTADEIDARWRALAGLGLPKATLQVMVPALPLAGRLRPQVRDPASFQACPPPLRMPERRRIGSYTALLAGRPPAAQAGLKPGADWRADGRPPAPAGAGFDVDLALEAPATALTTAALDAAVLGEGAGRDHDALAADDTVDPAAVDAADILAFPRGADAGTCLHAVLERIDFAQPEGWPAAIAAALSTVPAWSVIDAARRHDLPLQAMLQGLLKDLAATMLPAGFSLAELDPRRCVREFEFHLPVDRLSPDRLQDWLRWRGHAAPAFRFEPLQGHLKGFIDLVFEHQGRWYVLDWKSNHLGDRPADYALDALQAEVDRHDYALQALLYLLALHRFLACRLQDYVPARHLGGALYLFVRGVRPHWHAPDDRACGVWFHPGDPGELEELAELLAGRAAA